MIIHKWWYPGRVSLLSTGWGLGGTIVYAHWCSELLHQISSSRSASLRTHIQAGTLLKSASKHQLRIQSDEVWSCSNGQEEFPHGFPLIFPGWSPAKNHHHPSPWPPIEARSQRFFTMGRASASGRDGHEDGAVRSAKRIQRGCPKLHRLRGLWFHVLFRTLISVICIFNHYSLSIIITINHHTTYYTTINFINFLSVN